MSLALIILGIIFTLFGAILAISHLKFKKNEDSLVEQINAILPQTQCGQCTYPGCKPYAKAIAEGKADINQCPPGGDEGIVKLAELLGKEYKPLNAENGQIAEKEHIVRIDEKTCIGCTLCIQACPVDAILGSAKLMHTVIESECTGCNLCIEPCPVDCIDIVEVEKYKHLPNWDKPQMIS